MIFGENSARNDAIYGKWQAPVRKILTDCDEAWKAKSIVDKVFTLEKSTHFAESYTGLTSMTDFEPVGENGAAPHADMEQGPVKTVINETWKNQFSISREMAADTNISEIKKRPTQFVDSYYRAREKHGAAVLGGAISGKSIIKTKGRAFDIRCADGKTLFHTKHKNSIEGTEQSNMITNALSAEALGLAETHMQNLTDDAGNIIGIAPTTILIPNDAELKRLAFQAVGSMDDPAASNHTWNYQYGRWNILIWPYLNQFITAGLKPWMLIDQEYNEKVSGLILQEREDLIVDSYVDRGTDANVWKGFARFRADNNQWRTILCGGLTGGTTLS